MNFLDTSVLGLPLHPLVVHAVVVLLPLGAIGIALSVLVPKVREKYAGLSLAAVAVAFLSAVVAKFSGDALADTVGRPGEHEEWGERTVIVAGLLLVASALWWWFNRRQMRDAARPGLVQKIAGIAAVILAIVASVLVTLTGHSGSTEVWQDKVSAEPAPASTAPAAAPSAEDATEPSAEDATFTLEQVGEHDSRESCWAAVRGEVYDVTEWIARHPGGEQRILNLCGTDATNAFSNQHGERELPNKRLASFRIGTLAS